MEERPDGFLGILKIGTMSYHIVVKENGFYACLPRGDLFYLGTNIKYFRAGITELKMQQFASKERKQE